MKGYRIMQLHSRYKDTVGFTDIFHTEMEEQMIFIPSNQRKKLGDNGVISVANKTNDAFLVLETISDYSIKELEDGKKEIKVYPNSQDEEIEEEAILLYSEDFEDTKGLTKILGKVPNRGMILLKDSDEVTIKTKDGIIETFFAFQYKKKMYLEKKRN